MPIDTDNMRRTGKRLRSVGDIAAGDEVIAAADVIDGMRIVAGQLNGLDVDSDAYEGLADNDLDGKAIELRDLWRELRTVAGLPAAAAEAAKGGSHE